MESQPQNPKFRNNPENFHLCIQHKTRFEQKQFDVGLCCSLDLSIF